MTEYSYDADGNLVRQARTSPGSDPQIITMEYDALGRHRVWSDGTNEERTVYRDAAWHRWGTRTTGTNPGAGYAPTTHYLYDGSDVVADFASTGRGNFTLMKSYVSAGLDANLSVTHHAPVGDFLTTPIDPSGTATGQGAGAGRGVGGGSQPMGSGLGVGRGGRGARGGLPTSFYHADGLGSIRTLTNEQGIVTNTRDYTAFGEVRPSYVHPALGTDQRYAYTGREDSPLAAFAAPMYYRYRQYDPSIGRFTRRDPIGYKGGKNLYLYAASSITTYKDPFGLYPYRYTTTRCNRNEIAKIESALKNLHEMWNALFDVMFLPLQMSHRERKIFNKRREGYAKKYFLDSSPETVRRMTTNVAQILGYIAKKRPPHGGYFSFICCRWCPKGAIAYTPGNLLSKVTGNHVVLLCPSFFNQSPVGRAETLFHEFAHLALGIDDEGGYYAGISDDGTGRRIFMHGDEEVEVTTEILFNTADAFSSMAFDIMIEQMRK